MRMVDALKSEFAQLFFQVFHGAGDHDATITDQVYETVIAICRAV